jgi:hypothetical protein
VKSLVPSKLNLIPAALMIGGLCVLGWGVVKLASAQNAGGGGAPKVAQLVDASVVARVAELSSKIDELSKSRDALKDRLDGISHELSNAQWLMSVILAAAGLLTFAQGFFAFLAAQNYVAQAESAIRRANEAVDLATKARERVEEDLSSLVSDVRSRFPMLADAESMRVEAFNELLNLSPGLDVDQNLYSKADPITRERVLAIESFVAINFMTPSNRGAEVVQNLRLLGKFYAGKSLSSRSASETDRARTDFERAYFYYDAALSKSRRDYRVLNDLSWLVGVVALKPDLDNQRAFLEESLRRRPNQQRALYNMATILFDHADKAKLTEAKKYLTDALREPLWEEAVDSAQAAYISYNLACVYDGLAGFETAEGEKLHLLNEALELLGMGAVNAEKIRDILQVDLTETGDLQNLAASREHAAKVLLVRTLYRL